MAASPAISWPAASAADVAQLHLLVHDSLLILLPAVLLLRGLVLLAAVVSWQAMDAIAPACRLTLCLH